MIPAIIIIVVFAIFGGVAFITVKKIKDTDPNNVHNTLKAKLETAQEFMPYEDIKDSMINLGNHQYRAIIKCNSVNYNLKTDKEKLIIEASYQRFLNSLTHPISIFIQTKTMDNTKMLKNLKEDIEGAIEDFPDLDQYGAVYYEEMANVCSTIGNNKEKNKYIIVPYNEALTLTNLNDEEKYEHSFKELQSRCQIIIDNLQGVGIDANVLLTSEIIDLIYSTYHKDNASQIENIVSGEFLKMTVKGEDKLSEITDEGKLDWILYEAQSRMEKELLNNKNIPEDLKNRSLDAVDELGKIRDALAGEYKYTFNINDKLNLFE